MSELRDRISSILHDRYGYVAIGVPDAIMRAITDEAPETERQKAYNRVPHNLPGMVARPPEPKSDTVAALLTEAHRKLDAPLEDDDLRNAIVLVIAAVKELAK